MDQIYKEELKKNTLVFGVGEICTKILQYFVALFLSYFLTKSQMGDITLIKTTANIVIPIVSLDIIEAVFRFSADKSVNKQSVFSIGIVFCFSGFLLLLPSCILINELFHVTNFFVVYCYIATLMLHNIVHYFVKGIGKTGIYSINSLLYAFGTCAITLLLLFSFGGGIKTYFLCYCFTHIFCILFMFISCKLWKYFSIKSIRIKEIKAMLVYSIPLILTTIGWWLIGASDTYITNYFLGNSGVGILSYSHKFPAILNSAYIIFGMAVQLLAVSKFNLDKKEDKKTAEKLFSEIINKSISALCLLVLIISLFVQPIIKVFVHPDYYSSWQYVSLYSLGMVFYLLATVYGYIYNLKKKNAPLLISTLLCGILNIGLCFVLYKLFNSLYAAALSTAIAYIFVFTYRFFDSRRYIKIRIKKHFIWSFAILLISCLLNSIPIFETRTLIAINCLVLFTYCIIYKNDVYLLLNALLKKRKSR